MSYRPFDDRWAYYSRTVMDRPRKELIHHVAGKKNLCLVVSRQALDGVFKHALVTRFPAEGNLLQSAKGGNSFPLWLYSDGSGDLLNADEPRKRPNLAPEFNAAVTGAIGRAATPDETLAWIYAALYAPSYRTRYADFLKRDFPRIPLPPGHAIFDILVALGEELIALHTMEKTLPRITTFDVTGDNSVDKIRWEPGKDGTGRVYINAEQYFGKVPEAVWETHVGGYRVADKWLKERCGRNLNYDDLEHYQSVIAALARTVEIQAGIDDAIEEAGGWPLR